MGPTKRGGVAEEGLLQRTLLQGGASGCAGTSASQDSACTELGLIPLKEWALLAFSSGSLDAQECPQSWRLHLQNRHLQAALVPSELRYLHRNQLGAPEEWVLLGAEAGISGG